MPARFENLNVPSEFFQLIKNRAAIDSYQYNHHQVEPGVKPTPVATRLVHNRESQGLRRLDPSLPMETQKFRAEFPDLMNPPRGFRAPILDDATNWFPLVDRANHLKAEDRAAMQLINHRLAYDGLLSTLAQTLELLGPHEFLTNGLAGLLHLNALGFPDDLLAAFAETESADSAVASLGVVHWVAGGLLAGYTATTLRPQLHQRPFRVPASWSGFELAAESGGQAIERLRLQLGGGFEEGIVPGDSVHVIAQLVAALPQVDTVITVPDEIIEPFQSWAQETLPLRRPGQITLITAARKIESWAQDNGKAGMGRDPLTGRPVAATVTPRYASRHEGVSYFLPSESFLTDGLAAAGLRLVHFPLLFQGGNLLAVTEPATGRRTLLLGEGELHRNIALGLTGEQIVEIFRRGFGVDACVTFPGVSYHLDFDLSIRAIGDELVAFVNDPPSAVRIILGLGLDTFERHSLINHEEAVALRYDLNGGSGRLALNRLSELVAAGRRPDGVYRATTAELFKQANVDSGAGNLQVFLQALALLESEFALAEAGPQIEPTRPGMLQAFRAMDIARQTQVTALKQLGWRIVAVPSLPNFYRSINYLNGIQHAGGYLMPAYGGFYGALDTAAERVYRDELGLDAKIVRIQCAELQRKHGAVHCAAVAHPVIPKVLSDTPPVAGF